MAELKRSVRSWRSLLVVVSDLSHRPQLAVNKAAAIAARCGAKITLLHTYAFPYPITPRADAADTETLLNELNEAHLQALERLARPLRRRQLQVECAVVWDFPAHDAVIRFATQLRFDVILIESHRHGRISRWLLANTDWELIRACPIPLWFVKTLRLPLALHAMAAVDPLHAHDKPAALDDRIVRFAKQAATQLGGRVQLLHAYPNTRGYSPSTLTEPVRLPLPRAPNRVEVAHIKQRVMQLAARHHIPPRRVTILPGDPAQQLPLVARQESTHLMVMGAVSRRGALRAFIGNTAEKVIDQLTCDVVVIKPAGFKSGTPKQRARPVNY